jgi:hypothetical protein
MAFAGASTATAANTSAAAATQAPVIPGLGKTSTPNRVARRSRATHARVESKEHQITRQLNQASASGMATAQANVAQPGPATINETGARIPVQPAPAIAAPPAPAPLPPVTAPEIIGPPAGEPGAPVPAEPSAAEPSVPGSPVDAGKP